MRIVLGGLLLAGGILAILLGLGFYLSPQNSLQKVDAIVVISGGDTKRRTEEGIKLFREGWASILIFSGAAREGVSNASVMKKIAEENGVPSENIIIEENSSSTVENAQFTQPLLLERNFQSIILVTSPYHQRRAYLAFREALGKEFVIINHSALDTEWRKKNWWLSPEMIYLTLAELQKIAFVRLLNTVK